MNTKAILRIHCPDQQGLVFAITQFIFEHTGNITYLDQYTDPDLNAFFVRLEWELKDFSLPKELIAETFKSQIADRFQMHFQLDFSDVTPNIAIFVSKDSHCLFDLLARYSSGEFHIQIPLIISNHLDLQTLAEKFDIPFLHFPITKENQAEQEAEMLAQLQQAQVDLVILARYMRIVGPQFIEPFRNRIINIHHSMLPAFAGGRPYHAALERGVKMIGATSHYVTEDFDEGPIIFQDVIPVTHRDNVETMRRKGEDIEKMVLARAVMMHVENRVLIHNGKTVVFGG